MSHGRCQRVDSLRHALRHIVVGDRRFVEIDDDERRRLRIDRLERVQPSAAGDDFPDDLLGNTTGVLHVKIDSERNCKCRRFHCFNNAGQLSTTLIDVRAAR